MDIITNGPNLDLKQLPVQNSRSTYPLSSKQNEIISVEIKSYLKNQLLFIVHQMTVSLFLVFLLGTKKMAIKG